MTNEELLENIIGICDAVIERLKIHEHKLEEIYKGHEDSTRDILKNRIDVLEKRLDELNVNSQKTN